MLSIHLRLGLPSGLFPSGFPTNNLFMPLVIKFYRTIINLLLFDYETWFLVVYEEHWSVIFEVLYVVSMKIDVSSHVI
jgi:hypothetical protein